MILNISSKLFRHFERDLAMKHASGDCPVIEETLSARNLAGETSSESIKI